jgi:methionyl-tRNA formyltransferase
VPPKPQQGPPTWFHRRRPDQSRIEAVTSIEALYDHIRMLDGEGYPPAFLDWQDWRLEFSRAECRDGEIEATVRIRRYDRPSLPREKTA